MESRIKGRLLSIIVAGAMIASTSTALAATTKPTPKPTSKSTKKTVIKKPVAKRTTAKKKTVYKRKVVKVSPSPSPKWPPAGFTNPPNSEIYYKIPIIKELLGELSAAAALATQVKPCAKFACGVVEMGTAAGCTWWEVDSTVSGPLSATDSTLVPYGTLRTTVKGTNKKQIITVFLVSTELLKPKVAVGGINISCYHSPITEKIPTNVYTVNTPSPSATPTTNTN